MKEKQIYKRKPLLRYNGYEIDTDGNIWSLLGWKRQKERLLKPHPNKYGYLRVVLKTGNGRKTEFVHNLMIENFIGNKNGLQTRHLDGNKINNSLLNLKLGTAKENANDREKHGNTQRGELHAELIQLRKENYKLKKLIAAAPELLEFAIEMVRRYPNSPWIYEQGNKAIQKATK